MKIKKLNLKNQKIKIVFIFFIVTVTLSLGIGVKSISKQQSDAIHDNFNKLSKNDKLQTILSLRSLAIAEAKEAGDYRCCIEPACTMCYSEANKWNNFTAGTCACDDLIAKGEEACPQCQKDLEEIHNEDNFFCDVDATIATCDSNIK